MSRYPEYQQMSAAIVAAVRKAWDDNRAKNIARALGCSVITGKRIASTGRVSDKLRAKLVEILDAAIERNQGEMRQLREAIKLREYRDAREGAAKAARDDGAPP